MQHESKILVMRIILCALAILLSTTSLYAQYGEISGTIKSNGKVLEYANISLIGSNLGTVSEQDGSFTIKNIPYGQYKLKTSIIGYETTVETIVLSASQPTAKVNITLTENKFEIDEVVISGTMQEMSKLQSAVPVEVYSPKFFRANPAPSVFEGMAQVNGVRPQLNCNVCNTGDIHINGLEGPYTMILIDGMPIVSGLSTVYGLNGIPQSLVDRIEVVKGPASTLYGSEAVGGLVNVITKKPHNAPLISADIMATSWQELNTDIGLKLNAGSKATSLVGINYFNYQNPIDNNGDGFTDLTLQNRISVFNKWDFNRTSRKGFTLAGRYVYEDRWGGETNWNKSFRGGDSIYGESIYTKRWELFGVYELNTKEDLSLQFSANGHNQDSYYGTTAYFAKQYVGFSQLLWRKNLGKKHQLLSGASLRYTYYDDNTFATLGENGINNFPNETYLPGVFVQDNIKFNQTNTLLLSARYDYNSVHGNIVSPRVNYKWTSPNEQNIVRLSVGNGYRVANVFTEDHAALTGARKVVFAEKLKPETSWNTNLNVVKKYFTNSTYFTFDFSAWFTYFNNKIIPDYETNTSQIIYANLKEHSESKGVSLNANIMSGKLRVLAGVTFMDVSTYEDGKTTQQLLTERFTGVWNIGYRFFSDKLAVNYTGNVYGPMRLPLLSALDQRDAYSPFFSIQNIKLAYTINKHFEVYVGIKNLLNFTPPANSIARAHDPFDKQVQFDADGNAQATTNNPQALTFDPSYVYASNQGIRTFLGLRYTFD